MCVVLYWRKFTIIPSHILLCVWCSLNQEGENQNSSTGESEQVKVLTKQA